MEYNGSGKTLTIQMTTFLLSGRLEFYVRAGGMLSRRTSSRSVRAFPVDDNGAHDHEVTPGSLSKGQGGDEEGI
jgi:hypothetical protein